MRPAIILNSSAANLLFSNTSSVAAIEAVEAASASVVVASASTSPVTASL